MSSNAEDLRLQLVAQRQELSRLRGSRAGEAHAEFDGIVEKIDEALDKLSEGSYGICRSCGARIHHERLQALPYATRCITCQRREDAAGS